MDLAARGGHLLGNRLVNKFVEDSGRHVRGLVVLGGGPVEQEWVKVVKPVFCAS